MGKTQIAGTAIKGTKVSIDVDGITIKDFAKKSAETSGLDQSEWYKRFDQGMHDYANKNGIDYLDNVNVKDDASMQQAVDSIYANGGKNAYNSTLYPMFTSGSMRSQAPAGKPFFYDAAWQPTTSAEWHPDKWRKLTPEEEKKYAGQKTLNDGSRLVPSEDGTYAVKPQKDPVYADPLKTPYIARTGPNGGIYKVTNAADPSKWVYALKADTRKDNNMVEMSPATSEPIGIEGNPRGLSKPESANVEYMGKSNLMGPGKSPPSFEDVQREGRRLEEEKRKAEEAKKAKANGAKPRQGGSVRVKTGENSVRLGTKGLYAAYAGPGCVHEGGGHPVEGSDSCRVGKGMWRFARVMDKTDDKLMLNTGESSIEIG